MSKKKIQFLLFLSLCIFTYFKYHTFTFTYLKCHAFIGSSTSGHYFMTPQPTRQLLGKGSPTQLLRTVSASHWPWGSTGGMVYACQLKCAFPDLQSHVSHACISTLSPPPQSTPRTAEKGRMITQS